MINIERIHHVAIICRDYQRAKDFYTKVLGFKIEREIYRKERESYKLDLSLNGQYLIELFSFPDPPVRMTRPEAAGLRHIAFAVKDLEKEATQLADKNVFTEAIRIDECTGKKYTFFDDPDGLPIELYEL